MFFGRSQGNERYAQRATSSFCSTLGTLVFTPQEGVISLLKRRFIQDHTGHTALFHKLEMGNKNFCCNTTGDQIFDRDLGIPKKNKGQCFKVVYAFVRGNPVVTLMQMPSRF